RLRLLERLPADERVDVDRHPEVRARQGDREAGARQRRERDPHADRAQVMSSSVRPAALAPRAAGRAVPRRIARAIQRHRWPLLFVAPFFVLFAVFFLYPIGYSLWLSFRDWSLIGPARYIGLGNYRELLHDSLFW